MAKNFNDYLLLRFATKGNTQGHTGREVNPRPYIRIEMFRGYQILPVPPRPGYCKSLRTRSKASFTVSANSSRLYSF